jgi:signal recognition particle subunit SEC65
MNRRRCYACGKLKSIWEFYVNSVVNGKTYYRRSCKECVIEKTKIYYVENTEKKIEYQVKNNLKRTLINPQKSWAKRTIYNHRRRGFQVDLTIESLENIAKHIINCPICGVKLTWNNGSGQHQSSPTLDRVNNELYLNQNNIQILCRYCNVTKSSRTMKEFVEYCRMVVEKYSIY